MPHGIAQSEGDRMSTPGPVAVPNSSPIIPLVLRGCDVARMAAQALARSFADGTANFWDEIRMHEEELDSLDRRINEDVTATLDSGCGSQARLLLACLKFIIELERIGDLLLNVANRLQTVAARMDAVDRSDFTRMAQVLCQMLSDAQEAFAGRSVPRALAVLKADAELDRIRNLLFMRHIEHPKKETHRDSFHLVSMGQALERAGDHAKNLAEEVCHLVSGRSVRHILRECDRSAEQVYLEKMRQSAADG